MRLQAPLTFATNIFNLFTNNLFDGYVSRRKKNYNYIPQVLNIHLELIKLFIVFDKLMKIYNNLIEMKNIQ